MKHVVEPDVDDRHQDIRDGILDAAERLLVHYGYQKMTMQDLAREAGIGVGTTYLHFQGKADVALAVVARANGRVMERLADIAAGPEPAPDRLREMVVTRVLMRYESTRQVKHHLDELAQLIGPLVRKAKMPWMTEEPRLFAVVFREGRERDELGGFDDPAEAADLLLTATCGLMPGKVPAAVYDDPEAFRARTERMADLLLRAFAARPPGGGG